MIIGNIDIKSLSLGTFKIKSVWLGDIQVWRTKEDLIK